MDEYAGFRCNTQFLPRNLMRKRFGITVNVVAMQYGPTRLVAEPRIGLPN